MVVHTHKRKVTREGSEVIGDGNRDRRLRETRNIGVLGIDSVFVSQYISLLTFLSMVFVLVMKVIYLHDTQYKKIKTKEGP